MVILESVDLKGWGQLLSPLKINIFIFLPDPSGIQCFNANVIYQICERLPYSIYYQTCDIEEHGRGRLKKIAEIVTKATANAERRSIDRANRPYNSSITKSNTTQEVPATTTSQDPQPHNEDHTPRFDSWELLCKGTQRRYPTTNNIFHSPNYARQQGNLNSKPKSMRR